jgi:hypothetical protein
MATSVGLPMTDPVPAITEATATGETAEIFADIRRVLGVEVVNLIWRHLATIPGALPWAWGMLRPLYMDGSIAAEAAALRNELDLPPLPPFPAEALVAADLAGGDLSSIRNVLAAYDRTNAMAIVAFSVLLRRLDDESPAVDVAAKHRTGVSRELPPSIPLPPLPSMAELRPTTAELVRMLNRLGTRRDNPILASMYRHLAYWQAYLALAWTLIAPLDANGSLDRLIAATIKQARERSAHFEVPIRVPFAGPVDPTLKFAIRSALEPFTNDVIAKMVVICAVLRTATEERSAYG